MITRSGEPHPRTRVVFPYNYARQKRKRGPVSFFILEAAIQGRKSGLIEFVDGPRNDW